VVVGLRDAGGVAGLNVARLRAARGLPGRGAGADGQPLLLVGLQTIADGAMQIMSGMADVVLAGGVEMMSQVPMSGYHARSIPSDSSRTSAWASPPSAWPSGGR
jgi:acetyl-CoA acyltransferase